MKAVIYSAREDEKEFIEKYSREFSIETTSNSFDLTPETADTAKGYDGVIVIGSSQVDREVLKKLKSFGIKFIASRSIGFNNIDLQSAEEFGMKVSNAVYSPNSVSEYVILYSIMLLRHIPAIFKKMKEGDFSLKNVLGREIKNQTFGIVGTGKIGSTVAEGLYGMGAKILAYDKYKNKSLNGKVKYVSFDELLEKSDVVTLHLPLNKDNFHIINHETILKMKDNAILINTARGELIDAKAVLSALECGKLGGAGFDVLENEENIFRKNIDEKNSDYLLYKKLSELPNVIITPHTAFYTEQAVHDMVYSAFLNLHSFFKTGDAPNNLIKQK